MKKSKQSKKKKKQKSKLKKRRRQEDEWEENDDEGGDRGANPTDGGSMAPVPCDVAPPAKPAKEDRRAARAARDAAIPTCDPEGVPYGRVQLRRMRRRVKHGLAPIASAEEEREIRAREERERREEERLYAAVAGDEDGAVDATEAATPTGDSDGDGNGKTESAEEGVADGEGTDGEEKRENSEKKGRRRHNPPSKNTKRAKPVPADYVCKACNNDDAFPPHWIYDCPRKVTSKGCNAVAKRLRGLHDPPSRKVFVSGLPFNCDEGGVRRFFERGVRSSGATAGDDDNNDDQKLVHLKLLRFEDSKRCKGQAFLTFASDGAARQALRLNGAVWEEAEAEVGAKRKKRKTMAAQEGAEGGEKRKELRLKVTKVLNRFMTKKQSGGHVRG